MKSQDAKTLRDQLGKAKSMLAIGLLGLCSCSDQMGEEPPVAGSIAGQGGEAGYFVDGVYLDRFCVVSDVPYPIKTDERIIDGINPSSTDASVIRRLRASFAEALAVYPRRFFDEIGLRKIVLCRKLSIDGIGGQAFSDVEHGTLFLNIEFDLPELILKRTLHHEVFHFIDFAEDHRLDEDRAWSALNPITFSYGSGGGSMQTDRDSTRVDESLTGFLNRYSTSGLAEDKAEVYAYLMADGSWMIRRASADSILSRKVDQIRATLRRFGPLTSGIFSTLSSAR